VRGRVMVSISCRARWRGAWALALALAAASGEFGGAERGALSGAAAATLPDAAAAAELLAQAESSVVSYFPNRYSWQPCSLVGGGSGGDPPQNACKVSAVVPRTRSRDRATTPVEVLRAASSGAWFRAVVIRECTPPSGRTFGV